MKAAEAALKTEQAEVAGERKKLDAERDVVSRDLEQTLAERGRLVGELSKDVLKIYERIAHGRKGIALAEAKDGLCSACHVRLRPQVYNEVRRNDSIIQCDSCTRILYFVPAPGVPASPQASG